MLAPDIGSPASSSQNMISRYSCSATVAFSDDTSSPSWARLPAPPMLPTCRWAYSPAYRGGFGPVGLPFHQRADDRLVEALAHAALGDGDVVPAGQRGAQAGVVLGAVGDEEEAADRRRHLEILDRVADGDALARVVA